ncbi:TonB-dependent receptor [Pelomonas sp. KK5]|uniref:TonB-dependent receptor n=1 Tax=Pelomonas sp. KK5 TaxID=1855730 RepID=UPI001301D1E6|nr:TonB-dependent receptor [Pelomonas sp. KK5]
MAQNASDATQLERVTVTGSAIKRIDAETAVPVTVVKMTDLKKAGVTSVEQVMATLSSVQIQNNAAQAIGSGSGGSTFADMRGIGADKTLVLLNGQRIANNAVDGSAPDLNMIPFAAIERIEVLRDGASSLYGTDAIGGVINFITRTDLRGGSITIGADSPQHPGGKGKNASVSFGFGDIETQNFNMFGTLSYRKQDQINGQQRDFNKRIVGGLSNSTFPANYAQDGKLYNPAAPNCVGTALIPVAGGTQCKIVTPSFVDFSPKSETFSGLFKGTIKLSNTLNIGGELFLSRNTVTTQVAPVPYGGYLINPGTKYFPTNANLSPTFDDGSAGAPAFLPTAAFPNPVNVQPGFAYVFWRDFPNGPRQQTNKNTQQRGMLTADGSAGGWDYSVVAAYNQNKVDQYLTGGYADGDMIGEGLLEGVINPFGDQTPEALALINSAALNGLLQTATGKVANLNVRGSRELGDWFNASRPAQLAIGAELRHEKFISVPIHDFAAKVAVSTGVDPDFHSEGSRTVDAVFAELNVPVLKSLDITGSVRFDKYSDFGNTTNPKLSFRFQPMKELLVRGSVSTGFRAPTLYELYGNKSFTNTAGSYNNPLLSDCSATNPAKPSQCDAQFQVQNGGNPNLKPEKSKSGTLGLVYEPIANASLGADFWWVRIKDSIASIPQETLFDQYSSFQQYFHFNGSNNLSITSNCPGANCGYVDQGLLNLGGTNTNGVDLSAQYRLRSGFGQFDFSLNSTYVIKYEYQDYKDGPWNQNVGVYSGSGPVFRWQHNLAVNWTKDIFSAGAVVHYKSGYLDFNPTNTVSAFTTTDLFVGYSPVKALNLVLGVRNAFDKAPPFTNQAALFQAGGWDSRFADATGRSYYVRGTFNF